MTTERKPGAGAEITGAALRAALQPFRGCPVGADTRASDTRWHSDTNGAYIGFEDAIDALAAIAALAQPAPATASELDGGGVSDKEARRFDPVEGPRQFDPTIPPMRRRLVVEYAPRVYVRSVIEITFRRGSGQDESDPVREVRAYHDLDGTLLAEYDPDRGTIR